MPRRARPWYRASRQMWYANQGNKQVPLGVTDPAAEAAAWAAFQALLQTASADQSRLTRTVAEVAAAWLADAAGRVKPHTVKVYRWYAGQFLAQFGTLPLSAVTPERVEASSRRDGWSPTTRNNYLATVETLLRWAGVKVRLRKPTRRSAGADSVIPEDVYRRVLAECSGEWYRVACFLWHTGCRPSECAAATVEAVDWPNAVVRLAEHKTAAATGRDRLIYCNGPAMEVLTWQRDRHREGLLFRSPHHGGPISRQAFVMKFRRVSARIGRRVTAYGFRHTFATRALSEGLSNATVAALLGQRGTQMIDRHYGHLAEQGRVMRDAVGRLGGAA